MIDILPLELHGSVVGQSYYEKEFIIPFDLHYKFVTRNNWNVSVFAGFSFNDIFQTVKTDYFSDDYEKWFFYGGRRGGFALPSIYIEDRLGLELNHQLLKKYSIGLNVSTNPIELLLYNYIGGSPFFINFQLGRNFDPKSNSKINAVSATPQKGDLTLGIFLQNMVRYHANIYAFNPCRAIGGYAEINLSSRFSLSLGINFGAEVNTESIYHYYWKGNPNWVHGYSYSTKHIEHSIFLPVTLGFAINPHSNYQLKIIAGINPGINIYGTYRQGFEDGYRSVYRFSRPALYGYDEFGFDISHLIISNYELTLGSTYSYLFYSLCQPWYNLSSTQKLFNVPIFFHLKLGKVIPKKNKLFMGPGRI